MRETEHNQGEMYPAWGKTCPAGDDSKKLARTIHL